MINVKDLDIYDLENSNNEVISRNIRGIKKQLANLEEEFFLKRRIDREFSIEYGSDDLETWLIDRKIIKQFEAPF